jgi:hypothetical protein
MHTTLTRLKLQDDVTALAETYIMFQVRRSSNSILVFDPTTDATQHAHEHGQKYWYKPPFF